MPATSVTKCKLQPELYDMQGLSKVVLKPVFNIISRKKALVETENISPKHLTPPDRILCILNAYLVKTLDVTDRFWYKPVVL